MCGRYQFSLQDSPALQKMIHLPEVQNALSGWLPGDVHPSERAPVLLADGGKERPALLAWGFPGPSGKSLVINARAETAESKPMFRESVRLRRCIVPASGFYEWDSFKRKYLFRLPGGDGLWMAGLYDTFDGQKRFCILTTAPNSSIQGIHDRMPLILSREKARAWLRDEKAARILLHETPPQLEREETEGQTTLW